MRMISLLLLVAAACHAAVTPPGQIKVAPGFKVELLREAGPREGSWICMTQDDKGRLYISPQNAIPESGFDKDSKWGGMWRVTLGKGSAQSSVLSAQSKQADAANPKLSTEHWALSTSPAPWALSTPAEMKWERVNVPVGDAMGMLWAFDSLYVSGMGPQGRGIYRCTSSKHDGNLDTATLFKAIPGGAGEHGAHAIILGPDRKLYIVNGNSTGILDGLAPDSPYRNWGEDDLLPRLRDPVATFFDKIKAPYGCVYRTDADGTKWDIFAGGFRNPYDIAFNADGELFTYDSDMEWDRGLPWYRPTRLLHVVPGGEYGFREGSAKWPAYFPDSLPAVVDIGVGCPTGMKFGTEAKGWPEKYRRALFLHDWTYGRILAVHLHEKGASYTARNDLASYTYPRDAEANGDVEVFLSGKGMPVTDMEFLPDGSMVFTTGGRGTASGLYRVSWIGPNTPIETSKESRRVTGIMGGERAMAVMQKTYIADFILEADFEIMELDDRGPAMPYCLGVWDTVGRLAVRVSLEGEPSEKWSARLLHQIRDIPWERGSYKRYRERLLGNLSQAELKEAEQRLLEELKLGKNGLKTLWKESGDEEEKGDRRGRLIGLLTLARVGVSQNQAAILGSLKAFPFDSLDNELKLLKLRVLEVSFARQGRPSAEAVQALVKELLAIYPVLGVAKGAAASGALPSPAATKPNGAAAIPHGTAGTSAEKSGAERGADVAGGTPALHAPSLPVDAPAWRLNRELSQLLIWLTNPELGELNADAARSRGAPAPSPEKDGAMAPRLLGPVPNPGASVFPGRKGDPTLADAAREVIGKTLALMDAAPSQEEQIAYALALRWAHGWSPEQRVRYFRWFHEKAAHYTGGNSFAKFVEAIRADAASRVPEADRAALADWLRPVAAPTPAAALKPRAFVKAWTLPELEAALDALKDRKPDLARGKNLYTQAQCAQCHLFRDAGGNVGPDLTAVAQRFGRHDLLESITDPSKVVSEQYAMVTLTILDGQGGTKEVSGLIKEETSATITILTDPLAGKTANLYKNVVTKREKAAVSIMPPGLLFTLTAEEVADLLALFGAK